MIQKLAKLNKESVARIKAQAEEAEQTQAQLTALKEHIRSGDGVGGGESGGGGTVEAEELRAKLAEATAAKEKEAKKAAMAVEKIKQLMAERAAASTSPAAGGSADAALEERVKALEAELGNEKASKAVLLSKSKDLFAKFKDAKVRYSRLRVHLFRSDSLPRRKRQFWCFFLLLLLLLLLLLILILIIIIIF